MFTNSINIYHVGQQVSVNVDSWARFSGIESFANETAYCAMHANLIKAPTGEGYLSVSLSALLVVELQLGIKPQMTLQM